MQRRDCNGLKFCGNGTQLLLRDANAGHEDDSTKAAGNADKIVWNKIGNDSQPVSADQLISAVDRSGGTLTAYSGDKGALVSQLAPAPAVRYAGHPRRTRPPATPSCCGWVA